jgi:hypothetical protein
MKNEWKYALCAVVVVPPSNLAMVKKIKIVEDNGPIDFQI